MSDEQGGWSGEDLQDKLREDAEKVTAGDVHKILKAGTGKADGIDGSKIKWLCNLARQVKLMYFMVRDWAAGEFKAPWNTITGIVVALLYFLSPIDFVPDIIPVLGLADDAAMVLLVVTLNHFDLCEYCKVKGLNPGDYGLGTAA